MNTVHYNYIKLEKNMYIVFGEPTGIYRLKIGFFGLIDMPTEFQETYYKHIRLQNTFCFFDDITIVSTGSQSEHINHVTKSLKIKWG